MQSTPIIRARASEVMQFTPIIRARASDQMQITPIIGEKGNDEMPSASTNGAGITTGITARDLKENVLPQQSKCTKSIQRMQREERRPEDGGRTPCREEVSPRRGREHPAATPSPQAAEGFVQGELRWCMPLHGTTCSLFGSPILDTLDVCRTEDCGHDQPAHEQPAHGQLAHEQLAHDPGEHGQSAPPQQAGSRCLQDAQVDEWACAACTLVNAPDATRCLVCDALKGSTLASAATLALQDARAAPPAKNRAGRGEGSHVRASVGRTAHQDQQSSRQTNITDFIRKRS